MIFKQEKNADFKFTFPNSDYLESIYSFNELKQLFFKGEKIHPFIDLHEWIDKAFFSDLIASILQNYFKNNFIQDFSIKSAIALCSSVLTDQGRSCKFLGLIAKNKDEGIRPFQNKGYYKSFTQSSNGESFEYTGKVDEVYELFEKRDFQKAYNYFFIPGCQSIEMLDPRIRKGAILMTELEKTGQISNNFKFILSGFNNAKKSEQKVKFRNESLLMVNLLIHKLSYYRKINSRFDFDDFDSIITEQNSSDSNENILEFFKIIENSKHGSGYDQVNLFIISSTFHLLQLQKKIFARITEIEEKIGKHINVFYVGSENPQTILKCSDHRYVKLLFKEIISHNLKFPV